MTHSSCLGIPRPTHTNAAPDALIRSTISASSSGVSLRNGGLYPPATVSPGYRAVSRSARASGTPSAPP